MASKHLEEETKLKLLGVTDYTTFTAEYECESCKFEFQFKSVADDRHPEFCPRCGRRATVQ